MVKAKCRRWTNNAESMASIVFPFGARPRRMRENGARNARFWPVLAPATWFCDRLRAACPVLCRVKERFRAGKNGEGGAEPRPKTRSLSPAQADNHQPG